MLSTGFLVKNLTDQELESFKLQFEGRSRSNFYSLLNLYLEEVEDSHIANRLNLNEGAYYTLKSRFHSQLCRYLIEVKSGKTDSLSLASAKLNEVAHNLPRVMAIELLKEQEKALKKYSMYNELIENIIVQSRLQCGRSNCKKYSGLYSLLIKNKERTIHHQGLLLDFTTSLSSFVVLKSKEYLDKCESIFAESKELFIPDTFDIGHYCHYNIELLYRLNVEGVNKEISSFTIEQLLENLEKGLRQINEGNICKRRELVLKSLRFQYYYQTKHFKQAQNVLKQINGSVEVLFQNSHCCIPLAFLNSRARYYLESKSFDELSKVNLILQEQIERDPDNFNNYYAYKMHISLGHLYAGNYKKALRVLQKGMNVFIGNSCHFVFDTNLYLIYLLLLNKEYKDAEKAIKKMKRKLRDPQQEQEYKNVYHLLKVYSIIADPFKKHAKARIEKEFEFYTIHNKITKHEVQECLLLDFSMLSNMYDISLKDQMKSVVLK